MGKRSHDPTKPRKIAGTRIFVASKDVNLVDSKNIEWLKNSQITQVFCVFPLKQKQLKGLPKPDKAGATTILNYYKQLKLNPLFPAKLREHGIGVSSLLRHPHSKNEFRSFDSFLKEAKQVKKNFMIMCFGGWHASGAYAMYYLAANSKLNMKHIEERFIRSGYRANDLLLLQGFFKRVNIDINEVVKRKLERAKKMAAGKKVIMDAKRAKKRKKTRGPQTGKKRRK